MAEAFGWYEERKAGLGYDFLGEVRIVLERVQENPLRQAEMYHNVRRGLLKRFPYKVLYLLEGEKVEVLGVVHVKRDPQFWQRRAP